MGRIFKTPSDDAIEETLRSMHVANTVDVAYEKTVGWIRTILLCLFTAFLVSGLEYYGHWNLWEDTGVWIKDTLSGWSDAIF